MSIALITIVILLLVVAIKWTLRKRRVTRGLQCWKCGADLSHVKLHVDAKGRSRCPKCGDELDVTDVLKI